MPSKHDPADCLADILENIERIDANMAGLDRTAFARDGRTRDAVERCLERICEAAYRLRDQAEGLMPGQPWADIRGMGNRLRHAYDRMNLDAAQPGRRCASGAGAASARKTEVRGMG